MTQLGWRALSCLVAVAFPLTAYSGLREPDVPDPVPATRLSVCNLEGGPDTDGTVMKDFPGVGYTEYVVVLDRVAAPTKRALQARPSGLDDPSAALFAKAGLIARADKPFTLIVPRRWRNHFSIGWGGARRTERLRVDLECGDVPDPTWVGYPGGFWVDEAACVTLIVKTAHATKRVHLGIGEAC